MSGKKIAGIILVILGLIGAYYYIGGYFEVKSKFGNVFGVADETLKNYWPMMAASIAALILGVFLIFKGDDQEIESNTNITPLQASSNTNITPLQASSITTFKYDGDKSLSNDSYKIFLVKKYGIEKNAALDKIVSNEKLFNTIDDALAYADSLEQDIDKNILLDFPESIGEFNFKKIVINNFDCMHFSNGTFGFNKSNVCYIYESETQFKTALKHFNEYGSIYEVGLITKFKINS
jgi:hypothetical protein